MIVGRLLLEDDPGVRVVWAGRHRDLVPEGIPALDGWSCTARALRDRLQQAGELVVVDPMSFPWEAVRYAELDIPTTVRLPPELDPPALDQVLGGVLLDLLSPMDRLLEARPSVRDHLVRAWGVCGDCLVPVADDQALRAHLQQLAGAEPGAQAKGRKAVWTAVRTAVASIAAEHAAAAKADIVRIGVHGAEPCLARALERDLGLDPGAAAPGDDDVLDHLAVVIVPAGSGSQARQELFHRAHARLRSGGQLIVVATVVRLGSDEEPCPSTTTLVEDLQCATGLTLHTHELRSLRWATEPLSRGLLLAATSLALPRPRETAS